MTPNSESKINWNSLFTQVHEEGEDWLIGLLMGTPDFFNKSMRSALEQKIEYLLIEHIKSLSQDEQEKIQTKLKKYTTKSSDSRSNKEYSDDLHEKIKEDTIIDYL